ncbi:DNA-binding response OmpR family regulator [Heliobacterium gestii]|nr:DNA-binding response OmpR family regulator [Heliomicrobium gestii]
MMRKILVIDDDDLMQVLMKKVLEQAGYEVYVAREGDEGLRIINSQEVDLVITDIFMPGKEGLETIMEMRRIAPTLAIVAISGGGERGNYSFLNTAKMMGALDTLRKPFRREQFLVVVQECLQKNAVEY